ILVSGSNTGTSFLNSHRALDGAIQWSVGLGDTAPVIGLDGTIYVVAGQFLSAVSSSGQILWSAPLSGFTSTWLPPVVAADGSIRVAVSSPSRLYSFS